MAITNDEVDRFYKALGKRIAQHQKKADLSDQLLAALAGFDDRQLRAYKEGKRSLSTYRLDRIADVLGVSTEILLGKSPSRSTARK